MDSTMYFFDGSETCLKVIPALAVMSSSCGIARPAHSVTFNPEGGGGGVWCPPCPQASEAENTICVATAQTLTNETFFNSRSSLNPSWILLLLNGRARPIALPRFQSLVDFQLAIRVARTPVLPIRCLQLIMHEVRLRIQPRRRFQV